MAFKFLGITYVDFTPEGEKTPLQGFKLHFSEDIDPDKGYGAIPFSYFIRADKGATYGLNSSADMATYSHAIGKPVELSFDRKGKLMGVKLPEPVAYPPEGKPTKLGA